MPLLTMIMAAFIIKPYIDAICNEIAGRKGKLFIENTDMEIKVGIESKHDFKQYM